MMLRLRLRPTRQNQKSGAYCKLMARKPAKSPLTGSRCVNGLDVARFLPDPRHLEDRLGGREIKGLPPPRSPIPSRPPFQTGKSREWKVQKGHSTRRTVCPIRIRHRNTISTAAILIGGRRLSGHGARRAHRGYERQSGFGRQNTGGGFESEPFPVSLKVSSAGTKRPCRGPVPVRAPVRLTRRGSRGRCGLVRGKCSPVSPSA